MTKFLYSFLAKLRIASIKSVALAYPNRFHKSLGKSIYSIIKEMGPPKDGDDEVVFVEEITKKGKKSKGQKVKKKSCKSVVGKKKMGPNVCARPPANKRILVTIESGSADSFDERKPIAVIANTFSLSPNEVHWAPDITKTAESDTIAVDPSQITDWQIPVAVDEDVTGKKLVDGNNPSSPFHTGINKPRNTNIPPTDKDVDIDSPLTSESPSSVCRFPIFPKLVEKIEQGIHDRNEIESLKQQISLLSRKISEIEQAFPSGNSSIEHQQPQVIQSAPPKVECVDLCCSSDDEVKENGDISDDTEPNDRFEQDSNTAKQLLEFNFSKIEPLSKEDIKTFISYCKHVMKIRGLLYNDFINWSDTRGYSCSESKLSTFMNLRLGETGTRKMMFLMKQFLEDERGGLTMLSDAVESCIDKGRVVMKQKDLHNIDFLIWARLRLDLRLEKSVIGNFMNKKLNERRSREILPFFLQFLNDETFKPKKRKRRDGFTPKQLSVLMESFRTNPHPSQTLIQHLADHLCTTQFKIKRWFIDRKHETKFQK